MYKRVARVPQRRIPNVSRRDDVVFVVQHTNPLCEDFVFDRDTYRRDWRASAQHPVRGSGAKPKRGACYTGLRQRSPVVQLADTIRAAREKDFITLARDRAPYADFMQDRAALSAPAERARRHVNFGEISMV